MKDKTRITAADTPKGNQGILRGFALGYPGAHEEFPWGERVIKVKGKVFVFMGKDGDGFGLSTKLPDTATFALGLPFASPTGYGLGKAGWVSASFAPGDDVPIDMLFEWVNESYRAIAPRKLLAELDERQAPKKKRR